MYTMASRAPYESGQLKGRDLLSAIVPTYNRSRAVCSAIDSILSQTYSPIEIIVVDDGSTDDTETVLRSYGSRIRVIRQQNAGASAARNAGVRASQGAIVAFLDSDDIWLPRKIEKQVAALRAAGMSACCVSNMALYFNDGRTGTSFESAELYPLHSEGSWVNPAEVLATRFLMFNQCVAIRREAFDCVGGFDESLKVMEDYDLALKLSLQGPWAFVSEPLVVWKQSEDSLSHVFKHSVIFREAWCRVLETAAAEMPTSSSYARARNLVVRASRNAKRQCAARELSVSEGWRQRMAGKAYLGLDRLSGTVFRYSPWYPKMKTSSLVEMPREPKIESSCHSAA